MVVFRPERFLKEVEQLKSQEKTKLLRSRLWHQKSIKISYKNFLRLSRQRLPTTEMTFLLIMAMFIQLRLVHFNKKIISSYNQMRRNKIFQALAPVL